MPVWVLAVAAVDDEANGDAGDDAGDECDDRRTKQSVPARCSLSRRRQLRGRQLHPPRKNWSRPWNSVVSVAMEDTVSEDADYSRVRRSIDTCCRSLSART